MNVVIQTLKEHIADGNIRFVFPSQIVADLWAFKTCAMGIVRSVAANRFLAWDRFKEEAVNEKSADRQPATAVMRKLFSDALTKKNAEEVFLKALIPPEHARGGRVFAPFIAKILPSLAYLEKLTAKQKNALTDAEDGDYALTRKEYASFLDKYKLFEPSWAEQKISVGDTRYVIFFPELLDDFAEYSSVLDNDAFIFVRLTSKFIGQPLLHFASAREEIRSAVLELQRLHTEEGVPYEEMAVSVCSLEEMEPHLLREFALRHIPVTRRAGKKLGQTGAGRIFSLINECVSSLFSFDSLKALILNDHIPWKERDKNRELINFGIKYNCVCGYLQYGKNVDIWEEAFKLASNTSERVLGDYYSKLKDGINALATADSFAAIKNAYFNLWNNPNKKTLLDMENISEADNNILSRCIVELSSLVQLEEMFNARDLVPASPFAFFISCLDDKDYVADDKKAGVNIFAWRVAAASPFTCHFVLNASQSAATVLYQPLRFLRQDKRKALSLEDSDATGAFFMLSDTGEDEGFKSRSRISASTQTFSGWAIPHSFFAQGNVTEPPKDVAGFLDPYREERHFWKNRTALGQIFPLQKHSFGLWKNKLSRNDKNFSFFNSKTRPDAELSKVLKAAIFGDDGLLNVTPTKDLNVYYHCKMKWFYQRVFRLEKYSLEASLLDDTSLGLLYHRILEKLFGKIKSDDGVFNSTRLEIYKRWAFDITRLVIKEEPAFKGPLASPLVSPQAAGMARKISSVLSQEAKSFDGYSVAELEYPVSVKTGALHIKGVIDKVFLSPDGEPVIMDYKTTSLPEQTALKDLETVCLSDFQMPLYVTLYERQTSAETDEDSRKAQGAFYYSINRRTIKPAMGKAAGGRSKGPDREQYELILKAAQEQIEDFARNVSALNFAPFEIRMKDCLVCVYKTVCRSVYF